MMNFAVEVAVINPAFVIGPPAMTHVGTQAILIAT